MLRSTKPLQRHLGAVRLPVISATAPTRQCGVSAAGAPRSSVWSDPSRPRLGASASAALRGSSQHHGISTAALSSARVPGHSSRQSSGWTNISEHSGAQKCFSRYVSGAALRKELLDDANKIASGHGLPESMERDMDAAQPRISASEEDLKLGNFNSQRLHRVEASETVDFGVPVGGSGLTWSTRMDAVLARDSCTCPICVDPHSRQKQFQTSDIPPDIKATSTLDPEKQTLEITWTNDIPGYPKDHVTRFSLKPNAVTCKDSVYHPIEPKNRLAWNGETIAAKNKWIPYDAYMNDDAVLHEGLEQLGRYGLLFLTDVPDSEKSVEHIVSRIGILKDTFYGRTWDVKSVPEAKNIAYTPQFLGLHMDLMYVTNPPHLQLLHSLRARSPGGESLFADSLYAAFQLESTDKAAFDVLTSTPVPFYYKNDNQSYAKWRPTIELAPGGLSPNPANVAVGAGTDKLSTELVGRTLLDGVPPPPRIKCINYSPPFQAPFAPAALADLGMNVMTDDFRPYDPETFRKLHDALRKFAALVEGQNALFEHRLEEGQCVVFDNRRVLHARRAFDATKGERWLKGAYVDDDVFYSRWRVLAERFAGRQGEVKRVQGELY